MGNQKKIYQPEVINMNKSIKILFILGIIAIVLCSTSGCTQSNDSTSGSGDSSNQDSGGKGSDDSSLDGSSGSSGDSSGGSTVKARNCPNCGYYPQYKGTRCPECGYGDNDGILVCLNCGQYAFHGSSWGSGYCTNCGYTV